MKPNDKVPISCISQIEKKLKTFSINVRGDYIYTSSIQSHKVINLQLVNEHYTIDNSLSRPSLSVRVSYKEKIPVLFDRFSNELYDGITKRVITKEERNDIIYNYKSEYILIDRVKNESILK